LALCDVAGFVAATSGTSYRLGWWHNEVGRHLDEFIADSIAGRSPRLILMAPPRHGKTMLMGEGLGPALMARSPGAHVIYATHSQTLADKVSIKARRKVAEHLAPVFSHLEPSPAKWTASWWETAGGNSFRAVGVGVGTAGEGANIAVEDDPFGSKEDAYSAREQERVLDHYLSDIETRIMRGGGVAIMHTRWHRGDLIGRLMEQQPGVWRVLSWPAIAEVDEPHRRAGEALVPHLFPVERLHHLRQILSQQHGGAKLHGCDAHPLALVHGAHGDM
jgi:hypothetical protein